MSCSSNLSERTFREIYLPTFETAVKEAQPKTIMCSYNKINGVYASENKHLLTEILRDEWGFEGYVMTDWGAVADRVKGIVAGLDLEMPGSHGVNDARIIAAVKDGSLDEALLDKAVAVSYTHLDVYKRQWLNMIESFFSKMTRQMLRGIRVNSKQELEERIYKYFDEINREPVVYHWKYKMDEISEEEAASV